MAKKTFWRQRWWMMVGNLHSELQPWKQPGIPLLRYVATSAFVSFQTTLQISYRILRAYDHNLGFVCFVSSLCQEVLNSLMVVSDHFGNGSLRTAAAAAKSLQSCLTLYDPIDGSPPGSPCPWVSPVKNTGVGCHFLLQCMKVKSESEVAQLGPTPGDPMDCSLPGSSIHGIFQARVLEWVTIAFSP